MKMLFRLFSLLLLLSVAAPSYLHAVTDSEVKLAEIQQEKQKLGKIRKQLEFKLGTLGEELRKLDTALVAARAARREVDNNISETDKKITRLRQSKKQLNADIKRMEEQMIQQATAAYQRASREPGWLDVFAGVSVSEIPHRKKMLQFAMFSQEKDRKRWQKKVAELVAVEKEEESKRRELARLQKERARHEQEVALRMDAKRTMAERVRKDVGLNKEREKQLVAQEKALKRLIERLSEGLLGSEKLAKSKSVQKQKGRLPWPIRGKVVASFGSRPVPGRPKLTGVQLIPTSKNEKGKVVKAIADGQVRYADWFGGYGLMMIVDHGDGLISVYAHNDALYSQMGDWVEAGDRLAEAGSTGWIEGVRLYFEMRENGKPVNPKKWCRR